MTRWLSVATLAAAALAAGACQDASSPASVSTAAPTASVTLAGPTAVDPALVSAVAAASSTDQLEVIVSYDEGATDQAAVSRALLDLGAGIIQFQHLPVVAALATPDQISAMGAIGGVDGVWYNRSLRRLLKNSRASMRADEVHSELGIDGRGVGVAILDTGIDGLYNADLAYPEKTVANVKWIGGSHDLYYTVTDVYGDGQTPKKPLHKSIDLFADGANSETSTGHGTHVAGIVAGSGVNSGGAYKGAAPGASLIGLGVGDGLLVIGILAGFDYILEHRAAHNIQVVNNSWGSSGYFNAKDPINKATKKVYEAGITVVFAAGNCGQGDDTGLSCPTPDESQLNPYSVAPWVIGVAAGCKTIEPPRRVTNGTTRCEDAAGREPILADFSSRGLPTGDPLHEPDITAPGVYVVSTRAAMGTVMNGVDADEDLAVCNAGIQNVDYYTCASGTSMASPQIAGVVALMEQASGGTLTPDQALRILKQTARRLEGYATYEVGAGYVDAYEAVKAAKAGKK